MYDGMPIITSGMAGQAYCCGAWEYNPPEWSKYREDSHGYLRIGVNLELKPASMHVEYIRSDDGRVYDSFTVLAREHGAGARERLLEAMSPNAYRGNVSFSPRGTCHQEGVGAIMKPTVPTGLCPTEVSN